MPADHSFPAASKALNLTTYPLGDHRPNQLAIRTGGLFFTRPLHHISPGAEGSVHAARTAAVVWRPHNESVWDAETAAWAGKLESLLHDDLANIRLVPKKPAPEK
ncbi:hypothetical protein PLANPX_3424 [Lacipirellula parvula]|uniref:Uncharacterized protein n=1 Tax=Lacipirellula parvula TaxID=2650471 RepID=A0A5K7XCW2_9BACT|nr:hypothetical protein PLANPX_3424 [Lacipirellula parvula]